MLRLSILGPIWDRIQSLIELGAPSEEGGFFLARATRSRRGFRLVVDGEVPVPPAGKWRLQNAGQLAPTSAYMNRAAGRADREGRIPVFVHSHPYGPADFSEVDEWAFESWAPFFQETCRSEAFLAVIVAGDSIVADLWVEGLRKPFRSVVCGGTHPRLVQRIATKEVRIEHPESVDRQIRLWRERGQAALAASRVGIVGLGGTGSACAIQLARVGIGELLFVDPDRAETSNLSRLYGLDRNQARRRALKVDVVGGRVRRISSAKVETKAQSVLEPGVVEDLLDCDLILGCTDSQNSRALVNTLPTLYGVPFIDLGCAAESAGSEVLSMWADVRRLESGGPCLWCMGVLDPAAIAAEGLPRESRIRQEKEGYVRGVGVQPNIITMTTTAANIAVAQTIGRLMNQDVVWPTQFLFDAWSGTTHRPRVVKIPDCICGSGRWIAEVSPIRSIRRA